MNKPAPLRRRELMRRLALTTMGGASLAQAQAAVKPGTRVIVIGAGVSGLAAAQALHEAGLRVTVLEARPRIGGRVHTDRATFGVPVEIGAQYVQGTRNDAGELNPVWQMAQDQRWESVPFSSDKILALRDGEEVPTERLAKRMDAFTSAVSDAEDEIQLQHSVGDALRQYLAEEELSATQAAELRAMIASETGLEYAGDIDAISIQNIGDEDGYGGGNHMLPGGLDQVPALLAQGLPDIRLGEVVTQVDCRERECRVTTAKGQVHHAEHLLCTLPLGVLQAQSVRFLPALPAAKTTAIARMGMGCLGKIFLEFPERFWPEEINWFLSLKSAAPWGVAFSSLPFATPGRHFLVMWHSGTLAREREALSDDALLQIAREELRAASGEKVPAPLRMKATRWGRDPYSQGAYFFPQVNSPMSDIATLAQPVGDRLFFAGEATSPGMFATVPGAMITGWREAKRILKAAGA